MYFANCWLAFPLTSAKTALVSSTHCFGLNLSGGEWAGVLNMSVDGDFWTPVVARLWHSSQLGRMPVSCGYSVQVQSYNDRGTGSHRRWNDLKCGATHEEFQQLGTEFVGEASTFWFV